ncbi:hypothetical protein SDJN02_18095 [Cucurbita argyrosperma subsp. argyrosperma]|nr:hypothetical protein SDJN02_18095 [Cucurbita argyrosperma subsp. argyrosperma]
MANKYSTTQTHYDTNNQVQNSKTNLQDSGFELGQTHLRDCQRSKQIPKQCSIRYSQSRRESRRKPTQEAVTGSSRIELSRRERRNLQLAAVRIHRTPFFPVRHKNRAKLPHLFNIHKRRFFSRSLQKPNSRQ